MKKFKLLILFLLLFSFGISKVNALTLTSDTTLTDDISEKVIIDGANVTLDLNGHNIKAHVKNVLDIRNNSNVKIIGEGTIESTYHQAISVSNGSTLTMESGTVKSIETGVAVFSGSTFTMNGGTIETVDNFGIAGNGSSGVGDYTINFNGGTINANIISNGYISCGIYHPNNGTLNITGGTINSSKGAGVVQRGGTLNITGGTINANSDDVDITGKVGDSSIKVSASAVVVDKLANYPAVENVNTTISADAILNGAKESIDTIGENVVVTLIGGVYSDEPEKGSIPEGYNAYEVIEGPDQGKYVVVKEDDVEFVAEVGLVPEESVDSTELSKIKEAVKGKYEIVSYYDIIVDKVTEKGDILAKGIQPGKLVEVIVGIPSDLPKVKDGYVRKFVVVKVHNGEASIIEDVKDNGDNTVSFKSSDFSTYSIAYTDVQKTVDVPKTFDGILVYFSILVVAMLSLLITFKVARKNY